LVSMSRLAGSQRVLPVVEHERRALSGLLPSIIDSKLYSRQPLIPGHPGAD
jgi:hypothetical protein